MRARIIPRCAEREASGLERGEVCGRALFTSDAVDWARRCRNCVRRLHEAQGKE